jgi:hypothetical protein
MNERTSERANKRTSKQAKEQTSVKAEEEEEAEDEVKVMMMKEAEVKAEESQRHGASLLAKSVPANQELGEQEKGRLLLTSQIERLTTMKTDEDGQRGRMRTKTPDVDDDDGQQGRTRRTRDNNEGGRQGRTGHNNQKEVADSEG